VAEALLCAQGALFRVGQGARERAALRDGRQPRGDTGAPAARPRRGRGRGLRDHVGPIAPLPGDEPRGGGALGPRDRGCEAPPLGGGGGGRRRGPPRGRRRRRLDLLDAPRCLLTGRDARRRDGLGLGRRRREEGIRALSRRGRRGRRRRSEGSAGSRRQALLLLSGRARVLCACFVYALTTEHSGRPPQFISRRFRLDVADLYRRRPRLTSPPPVDAFRRLSSPAPAPPVL
jgi:hypothetical protein